MLDARGLFALSGNHCKKRSRSKDTASLEVMVG